jgi:hypothetical protein
MNRALHRMTDEERAAEEAMIKRIMHEVQTFEPTEPPPRFPWEWIAYAAALCVVVAWVVVGRM